MKTFNLSTICLMFFTGTIIMSCNDDTDLPDNINEPVSYQFARDGISTVSYSGQTQRLAMAGELVAAMTDPQTTIVSLQEMFANESATGEDVAPFSTDELNTSTKSVRSKVAASKDLFEANTSESAIIKAEMDELLIAQVSEVFPRWNELASVGLAGQIADGASTRYVNAKGLEYDQAVAKTLLGALMGDQIMSNYLSEDVLYAATNVADNADGIVIEGKSYTALEHYWDEAYGYMFGGAADGANPLTTLGEDDDFLNKYLSRVEDDSDFNGISQRIFDAYKLGRAAIVANEMDVVDDQRAILRSEISNIIGIRSVYYLQKGKINLAGGNTGSAFHDLSEGYGFINSLRFTRSADGSVMFTRAEVDNMIAQLTAGNGFWDITDSTLDSMSETIAAKFDFTVAQAGS